MSKELKDILYDVANFYSKRDFSLDGGDFEGVDEAEKLIKELFLGHIQIAHDNSWTADEAKQKLEGMVEKLWEVVRIAKKAYTKRVCFM